MARRPTIDGARVMPSGPQGQRGHFALTEPTSARSPLVENGLAKNDREGRFGPSPDSA
jgi:hypothetical protein